jgi:hypothetical protein
MIRRKNMLKVTNSPGRPMNGKRLNNFGGKNPQVTAPTSSFQRTARGKSINNFGGKNPQKQASNAMSRLFGSSRRESPSSRPILKKVEKLPYKLPFKTKQPR